MPAPWLIISKPLRPPFRDGSTVLIRDLVRALPPERRVVHLGDPARPLRADTEVIDIPAMGYSPGLWAKVRVLAAMLHPRRRHMPVQLCFTPNPITSRAVALLRFLQPRRLFVQSLMSAHGAEGWVPLLRPLDAVVVLSQHTERRLIAAGVPAEKLHLIYPAVAAAVPDPPAEVAARRRLLYAGDLDAEVAARLIALARALHLTHSTAIPAARWSLTIACRPKSEGDAAAREALRAALPGELAAGTVELLGEVDDMDALLRSASLQLYAADHVRRKVDLPLVLLEGLARGVPVVAVDADPVRELYAVATRHDLAVGAAVPAAPEAFARAVLGLLTPHNLQASSAAAAVLAAREFSLDVMARCYGALHAALETERAG
jgi:glycosyltransferase involved in cell wall biosynthesis